MKFLITGGAGFIGSHIAETVVREGHSVRILDNLSSGREENLSGLTRYEFLKGDICDTPMLEEACLGMDGIFHEAAAGSVFESVDNPLETHRINATGTLNVFEAARKSGVKRVVLASSASLYGNDPVIPKTEDMLVRTESPYAAGKAAAENFARLYANLYGVEAVCLRCFNVFGPRQNPKSAYSGVISRFAYAAKNGGAIQICGDGLQTRDFVFVKDVAIANWLAMTSKKAGKGEIFNIGTGRAVTLLDVAQALSSLAGMELKKEFLPPRTGDIKHSRSDISKAKNILSYQPQTSLEEGLKLLLESIHS